MGTQYATHNYYQEERNTYRDAYDIKILNEEVDLIVGKICRHYKVRHPIVRFYGSRDSGSMGYKLTISNFPSMGLIIHELCHRIQKSSPIMRDILKNVSKKGTDHHGLHFQVTLSRVHDWAKKKGYWQEEIQRRREKAASKVVKVIREEKEAEKPENALQEKIDETRKKIQKQEDAKVRYNKKLQRLKKLYATKTKKANRSIGALKRALAKYEEQQKSA